MQLHLVACRADRPVAGRERKSMPLLNAAASRRLHAAQHAVALSYAHQYAISQVGNEVVGSVQGMPSIGKHIGRGKLGRPTRKQNASPLRTRSALHSLHGLLSPVAIFIQVFSSCTANMTSEPTIEIWMHVMGHTCHSLLFLNLLLLKQLDARFIDSAFAPS